MCATLSYFGFPVEAIDKTNKNKVDFLIKRNEKLDELVQAFWTHQLMVEPMAYFNFIKELKNRIYQ